MPFRSCQHNLPSVHDATSSGKTELARRRLWMVEEWHRLVP